MEFLPGEQSKELIIQTIDDKIDEGDKETIELGLSSNTGYQLETSTKPQILNPNDQGFSYLQGKAYNHTYKFIDNATVVKTYQITAGNIPSQSPKNWKLLASHNNTDWIDLDTKTNVVFNMAGATQKFTINNNTAYEYYRLEITDNNGGNGVAVGKVEFSGPPLGSSALLEIKDNDTVGVTVVAKQIEAVTDEQGKKVLEYNVKLNSQPDYPVIVSFGTNDLTEAKVKISETSNLEDFVDLTFTPENWDKEQKFYV